MGDSQSADLSRLRVFTNRGTVAYPLAADGPDPTQARESPGEEFTAFAFDDSVSPDLRDQLGAVLVAVDSKRNTAWSYFRGHTDRPVQLTAECFGTDVEHAVSSLPVLVEEYMHTVRDGEVVARPLEEVSPDADELAYTALTADGVIDLPWSPAVFRRVIEMGPVEIRAPSITEGVYLSRYLATDDAFPPLRAVVTKGARTQALADADVVIRVDDCEEYELADPVRLRDARLSVAGRQFREELDGITQAALPAATSRGRTERLAAETDAVLSRFGVTAAPKRRRRLTTVVVWLFGVMAGLALGGGLTEPALVPTTETLSVTAARLLAVASQRVSATPLVTGGVVATGTVAAVAIGLGWRRERGRDAPFARWIQTLRTSPHVPSLAELLLGGLAVVTTALACLIGYLLWTLV
ncbi:hypothetical protein [Halobaculum rubrum]|uniref:hypothetical protein n=1 Tax=Halobaculum rubrum TaxID=2872158 RepID=UPI001CA44A08|nr:hypothetical protein [Halobaculum rubrum]QZY01158.1 hypothetical protein K6T25_15325 [Halobaculum rubrum]